jgi:hypothetical protein
MNKAKAPVRRAVINKPSSTEEDSVFAISAKKKSNDTFALTSYNYKLIGIGIGILIIGYILLSLEKFKDATEFSIALYVAPFVILAGYAELIYAVMAKPPKQKEFSSFDA